MIKTINCSKKEKKRNLPHNDWVEYQFDCNLDREYRDTILHTSFIESVIIFESEKLHHFPCPNERGKYRNFSYAFNLLKISDNYSKEELEKIDLLWNTRNELIHGIIKTQLKQKEIEKLRDNLYCLIIEVYRLKLINDIFKSKNYPFLPQEKIAKLNNLPKQQIIKETFDT